MGEPFDLLVIGIDLDIAIRAGIEKAPSNLKAYDARALCDIVKSWLPQPVDGRVLIVIPVMAVEAWIVAAVLPRLARPELERNPAELLAKRKKIAMGSNGPWKRVNEYREFAREVTAKLGKVRSNCNEANRFVEKLSLHAKR